MKKYTLLTTLKCNLRCTYCYVGKRSVTMSLPTVEKIIEFIYGNTPDEEKIDLGFFGGEPLLEFEVMQRMVGMLQSHPKFDPERIEFSITTNGTIFNQEIAAFLKKHRII